MSTRDELTGRGERSRDAILDAAEALMAERGFAGTPISAICKATGLPPSSVYWHFGSKDGVLAAVIERAGTRYLADLGNPDISGVTPAERLAKLLGALARFATMAGPTVRFLLTLGLQESNSANAQAMAAVRRVRGRIYAWVGAGLADIFPAAGTTLIDELTWLVVAATNGSQVATWAGDELNIELPIGHLTTAVTAIVRAAASS